MKSFKFTESPPLNSAEFLNSNNFLHVRPLKSHLRASKRFFLDTKVLLYQYLYQLLDEEQVPSVSPGFTDRASQHDVLSIKWIIKTPSTPVPEIATLAWPRQLVNTFSQ